MGLTAFVDDLNLEDRVETLADERLNEPGQTDPVLVIGDIDYEERQEPKHEIPKHLKTAHEKAQQARANITKANIYRRRKGRPTIRDYPMKTLIMYFLRHPDVKTNQIVGILEEQQRGNLALSGQSPQDNYIKAKY